MTKQKSLLNANPGGLSAQIVYKIDLRTIIVITSRICFFQQRVHNLVEDGSQPDHLRKLLHAQTEQDRIKILTTSTEDEKGQVQ